MEYTLYSVMLCHARSFSVMDVVGHWGCNSPGDCEFIVLHFYMCPGVLPCVAKNIVRIVFPKLPLYIFNLMENTTFERIRRLVSVKKAFD